MALSRPLYTIRKATRADVPIVKALIDNEGWEVDLNLLYCVYDMDSRAWFVAESETGEVIGVQALTYFNDEVTAGGIYIIKPKFRGYGVGRDVNTAALGSIGDNNIITSASNVSLYNTRGFTNDFDIHHKRISVDILIEALPICQLGNQVIVKSYSPDMLSDVIQYDAGICKHERSEYVKKWIIQTSECVLVAYSETANVIGFGCLRRTEYGHQVAPLYADSETIAWYMMKDLLGRVNRKVTVGLFINDKNEHALNLCRLLFVDHDNGSCMTQYYCSLAVPGMLTVFVRIYPPPPHFVMAILFSTDSN